MTGPKTVCLSHSFHWHRNHDYCSYLDDFCCPHKSNCLNILISYILYIVVYLLLVDLVKQEWKNLSDRQTDMYSRHNSSSPFLSGNNFRCFHASSQLDSTEGTFYCCGWMLPSSRYLRFLSTPYGNKHSLTRTLPHLYTCSYVAAP